MLLPAGAEYSVLYYYSYKGSNTKRNNNLSKKRGAVKLVTKFRTEFVVGKGGAVWIEGGLRQGAYFCEATTTMRAVNLQIGD